MVRDVVLVHGLWMPGLVMTPLAARLAAAGFRAHVFGYPSRQRPLGVHAERLRGFVHARLGGAPAHFVGHSLGGLVVLEALRRAPAPAVASVLLLGTPVNGCMAGRRLARHGWGRWMLGASAPLWREAQPAAWAHGAPLAVLAGSQPIGLARVLGRLPGVNDGVVTLEEATFEGTSAQLVMPVGHSEMLISARVARQVIAFLRAGRFDAAQG